MLFKIFDTKIIPILTYGAEIWSSHRGTDIEKVHHDYCKYVCICFEIDTKCFGKR